MANKINELKVALGAGARSNKYRLNFSVPAAVSTSSNLEHAAVLCRAASFPGKVIGQAEANSQGRKLVIPGDTTYTTVWSVTFYSTEDHGLRRDILEWMKDCDHFQNNEHSGVPAEVLGELSVEQLDSKANGTAKYTFHNVFPQSVSEIAANSDPDQGIQEFEVTFSFTDWVVGDGEFDSPSTANAPTLNPIAT